MNLQQELETKFGKENVNQIYYKNTEDLDLKNYKFFTIDIQMRSKVKILMTSNLHTYKMPVLEKFKGKEFIELYFCLPSYWDLDDQTNPNMNWVFEALYRLQKFVLDKQTWLGTGHTIPNANPLKPISNKMKQSYFFFNEPLFLKEIVIPIEAENLTLNFLAVIPIFEDELDYKLGKGTFKFQKKLNQQNVTELLDDYRSSVLKTKWRFWGK